MKNVYKIVLVIILFFGFNLTQAQNKFLRYTTYTQRVFSFPPNIHPKEILSDQDVSEMDRQDVIETTSIEIEGDKIIRIDVRKEGVPETAVERNDIWLTRVTHEGIFFLNYDEEMISHVSLEEAGYDPESFQVLSREEYGFKRAFFATEPPTAAESLCGEAFSTKLSNENKVLQAAGHDAELYIDFENYVEVLLLFEKTDEPVYGNPKTGMYYIDDPNKGCYSVAFSEYKYHTEVEGGYIIPNIEVSNTFETLPNGIRRQQSDIKRYLAYYVEDKGKVLVDVKQGKRPKGKSDIIIGQYDNQEMSTAYLTVYPNPATDQITLVIPSDNEEAADINIVNSMGISVFSKSRVADNTLMVDVSAFNSGVYIVNCKKGAVQYSIKFIKE